MKLINLLYIPLPIIFSLFHPNNTDQKVTDYFTIPGVQYNNTSFQLSWGAHPSGNYYKQEYLPAGEKSDRYHHMIMIEAVTGDIPIKNAISSKIQELEDRKKTDALVNYQVIENKVSGEYMLDFILSQSSGKDIVVVEWNVYRYTSLKDASGNKGVQLFAFSKRAYGAASTPFLKALKTERPKEMAIFSGYKVPPVVIKQ